MSNCEERFYFDVEFEKYNRKSMKYEVDKVVTYFHFNEFDENEINNIVSIIINEIINDFGLREGNSISDETYYEEINKRMLRDNFKVKPIVSIRL